METKIRLSKNNGWWRGNSVWHFFLNNKTLCKTYNNVGGNIYLKNITRVNKRCPKCQRKIEQIREQCK